MSVPPEKKTRIILYYNCQILPWKNFKVDDIEDYLDTLDPQAINSSQLIKHNLETTFKLIASEDLFTNPLDFEEYVNCNYLSATINYPDPVRPGRTKYEKIVYYFVVGKKWISQDCVELQLKMDVVNTFADDIVFSPKTTILRQHKNRWRKGAKVGDIQYYEPIVDPYTEGINTPLYKKSEETLYFKGNNLDVDEANWYLIYKSLTTDQDSPIQILACSDIQYTTGYGTLGFNGSKDPRSWLGNNRTAVIYGADTGTGSHNNIGASVSFTDKTGSHTLNIVYSDDVILIGVHYVILGKKVSNGVRVSQIYSSGTFKRFKEIIFRKIYAVRKATGALPYFNVGDTITDINFANISTITNMPLDTAFPTSQSDVVIGTINDIDRTDPKLLKIIKLPYPPFALEDDPDDVVWDKILLPTGWGVQEAESGYPNLFLYENGTAVEPFKLTFLPVKDNLSWATNPYGKIQRREIANFGSNYGRNNIYEPKLLHSDYYQPKFVYDSFYYIVKYELLDSSVLYFPSLLNIEFSITTTMNSRFMFRFFDGNEANIENYFRTSEVGDVEDYSDVLYVVRNNELPIFNSAYLNYIKTGYNYDVKTKNRQLTSSIISGVLTTAGAVVSAVAGAGTGGIGFAGAVALGTSAFTQFARATANTIQAEQNIAQKLKTAEMQGLSIAGSDDVDLMSEYTKNNKLKLVEYKVSIKMEQILYDLFYYYGYVANIQGIPDTSSRMWFNFIQAEILLDQVPNLPQTYVDELTNKYREGITYLHKGEILVSGEPTIHWDFEQEYENWEVL